MLNKKISLNRKVAQLANELGGEAALVYTWAIAHLDRDGRITGDPETLCAQVAPMVSGVTPEVVGGMLELASRLGLIFFYDSDGEWFVEYPKFKQNQQGMRYDREAESTIPEPSGTTPDPFRTTPDLVRRPPAEGKGREGKVKEKNESKENEKERKSTPPLRGVVDVPLSGHPEDPAAPGRWVEHREIASVADMSEALNDWGWPIGISGTDLGKCKRLTKAGAITKAEAEYARGESEEKPPRSKLPYFLGIVTRQREDAAAELAKGPGAKPAKKVDPYAHLPMITPESMRAERDALRAQAARGDLVNIEGRKIRPEEIK